MAFSILPNLREGAQTPGPARKRVEDRDVMAVLRALDIAAVAETRIADDHDGDGLPP